ncbi:hypothetical protein PCASD_02813 [Puccinia coronata f. sp. avenae]|uniref:Uncharacterized protein n=1 Tax=Puccinia coronata f. sp. avenae TaxID=200324 RepID=A0A2N5VFT7_9BASI|nr:hypothetical protein PCASD_02813 [Puccinia coronata f. sp. avenae]
MSLEPAYPIPRYQLCIEPPPLKCSRRTLYTRPSTNHQYMPMVSTVYSIPLSLNSLLGRHSLQSGDPRRTTRELCINQEFCISESRRANPSLDPASMSRRQVFDLTQPRLHESDACTAEELGMSNRSDHSLHPSLFLSRFSLSKKRTRTVLKRFYLSPS